jgi:hypothetical protein
MLKVKETTLDPENDMAFLLIIPAWLFLLSLVIGLCHAARLGDRPLQQVSPDEPHAFRKAHRVAPANTTFSPRGHATAPERLFSARANAEPDAELSSRTGAPRARASSGEAFGAASRVLV